MEDAARRAGLRLIALDRPGYGRSDFERGRRLARIGPAISPTRHSPRHREVRRHRTLGRRPACAGAAQLRMPERLDAAAIVSGAGDAGSGARWARGVRRMLTRAWLWATPAIAWLAAMWVAFWAPYARPWMMPRRIDRRVMQRREVREAFIAETKEALRNGGKPMAQDLALFARRWRFTPADIGATRVFLWHGDADTVVPVAIGRYYARTIPGCEATFVPGAGHLMLVEQADAILAQVASAANTRVASR